MEVRKCDKEGSFGESYPRVLITKVEPLVKRKNMLYA